MERVQSMTHDDNELIPLFLHFLHGLKYHDTLFMLGKESGIYFDLRRFEYLVISGFWDEAESYISAFINLYDDDYSNEIFFTLRKYKYLEAIDSGDWTRAAEILMTDLKIFEATDPIDFDDLTRIIALDNIREHPNLKNYGTIESTRVSVLSYVKDIIFELVPRLRTKMSMPAIKSNIASHPLSDEEIINLILQSLDEEQYSDTKRTLEESR